MVISAYQVDNILRVYGDQLRQSIASRRPRSSPDRTPDTVSISASARRKAVIDRIAAGIVERIARDNAQETMEAEAFRDIEKEFGVQLDVTERGPADLIFKVIDEQGETVNQLSIEDSKFLRYKLEEISKEEIEQSPI
ncbi:MAG: hypothetical protein JRJ31_22175 [Deltaproteobacteria bacterium]|nr:hypothetical protein [Deltaproteobacteria bacterium]